MSAEEESDPNVETDNGLSISGVASNSEFCLVFDDEDVEDRSSGSPPEPTTALGQDKRSGLGVQGRAEPSGTVDVDAIKRKADEIASSLQKFRSSLQSGQGVPDVEDIEPPAECKQFHERSLFVAQKLKEDRILYEESKKRNEAVFDKVRNVKRIQRDTLENVEEPAGLDETYLLKQKVNKLESTIAHLQNILQEKNQTISEKNESIRNLNESISSTYAAHMCSLEQSQDEIKRVKDDYVRTIERINNSKDEFCNELQIVRQKYLQVENELKLSNFARCRLVSRDAQLREKINELESENRDLKNALSVEKNPVDGEEKRNRLSIPDLSNYVLKEDLLAKIECVDMIVNEFQSFLVENADFASDDEPFIEDDDCVEKSLEKISDKLESMFYLTKDKLHSVTSLQITLQATQDKLARMETLHEENKQQETKLKKLLAGMKVKVNANKELTEELAKAKEYIESLKHVAKSSDDAAMESLRAECGRLHEENNEIAMLLEMKSRELETLSVECENLRKAQAEDENSSDKTENDFVVLQTKDAECEGATGGEDWKEKYEQLCENNDQLMALVRSKSEKEIEWENEKLQMQNYQQEAHRLRSDLERLTQTLQEKERALIALDAEMQRYKKSVLEEREDTVDSFEAELQRCKESLREEERSNGNLKEQLRYSQEVNDKLTGEIEQQQKYCDEVESIRDELSKKLLVVQESNQSLKEQVRVSVKKNETLEKTVIELQRDYDELESLRHELSSQLKEAQKSVNGLQAEKENLSSSLEAFQKEREKWMEAQAAAAECEKYKIKYQKLQVYCKANINKNVNEEVGRWRSKCEELQKMNKRLQEGVASEADLVEKNAQVMESYSGVCAQLQEVMTKYDELESVNAQLQGALNEYRQGGEVQELRTKYSELESINAQLQGTLNEYRQKADVSSELENVKLENENLAQMNEQLTQYCNWAKEQLQVLGQTEAELRQQYNELQTTNGELTEQLGGLDQAQAEVRRLTDENEKLTADYGSYAKWYADELNQRSVELEQVKRQFEELQGINQRLETALNDVQEEKGNSSSEVERLRLENEALIVTNEQLMEYCNQTKEQMASCTQEKQALEALRTECEDLRRRNASQEEVHNELVELREYVSDQDELIKQARLDLRTAKHELEQTRGKLESVELSVMSVTSECAREIASLTPLVAETIAQNERNRVEKATAADKTQVYHDEEAETKRRKEIQCNELLKQVQKYERDLSEERQKYETLLSEATRKIDDLKERSAALENQFAEKEGLVKHYKALVETERIQYEAVMAEMGSRSSESEQRTHDMERCSESEQRTHDMERYKSLISEERDRYESIIQEMRQNLEHYKSLVEQERDKYERIVYEMQQSINKYEEEMVYHRSAASESERITESVQMKDPSTELKMLDAFRSEEKVPSIIKKYYNYGKDVIQKEIKDILQPSDEDAVGDWSNAEAGQELDIVDTIEQLKQEFTNKAGTVDSDWALDSETVDEYAIALKFAELVDTVIYFFNARGSPYVVELLKKLKEMTGVNDDDSQSSENTIMSPSREHFTQLLITAQRLEQEKKYLLDAVTFFENLVVEYSNFECENRFPELLSRWRESIIFDTGVAYFEAKDESIDGNVILPEKLAGEFAAEIGLWKEVFMRNMEVVSVRGEIRDSPKSAENTLVDVYKVAETVKAKLHELICDLHYVYSSENAQVNPVEFFEQIEEINGGAEDILKIILNDDSIRQDVAQVTDTGHGEEHHDHEHHEHDHHDHEHHEHDHHDHSHHEHGHHEHGHDHHEHHDHEHQDTNESLFAKEQELGELKSILNESNKKIQNLTKELMDVKASREYNEVQQLHTRLDDTLYQLHVQDVRCVELTQELTQLLSERDSLQLKLSTILRQNEQLKEAQVNHGVDVSSTNLENKLEELQRVNYMKDPRISESSRQLHASQMQLFSEDTAESGRVRDSEGGGGLVPSLFKWITGDTEEK